MQNMKISNQTCPNSNWPFGLAIGSKSAMIRRSARWAKPITTSQLFLEDFFFSSFSTLLLFLRWLES